MCFVPQRRALFRDLNLQTWREHVVFCTFWREHVVFLYILTSKCASRHNGVHFFDISTSKVVFCTFWLRNVLRATTACTFSTSQLPKVVRTPQFLTHVTSKCASRHNGVQLFISHLPRCLRTRRFSEPTFQPSGVRSHKATKKHSVSRLSYFFAHLHLLSSDLFSSDSSPCWLLFHLSILSEVWLPNFLR